MKRRWLLPVGTLAITLLAATMSAEASAATRELRVAFKEDVCLDEFGLPVSGCVVAPGFECCTDVHVCFEDCDYALGDAGSPLDAKSEDV